MTVFRYSVIAAVIIASFLASYTTSDNFIDGIASGVISGLIASVSLIFIIGGFKPRMRISPFILIAKTLKGGYKFSIKVVNKTGADLVEPKAAFHFYLVLEIGEGQRRNAKRITLVNSTPMLIRKRRRSDAFHEHVYIFNAHVTEDVKKFMHQYSHLRFRVVARHPSSGAERVFEQTYSTEKRSFRSGVYKTGGSFGYESGSEDFYAVVMSTET